jgi:hypothetical protein
MGRETYPGARQLLITADRGGSHGSHVRLWKRELQELADETRLEISVCHFPPGTSQWNKIEHRLFSFLMKNRRGQPRVSQEVIGNLIAATTTRTDLRVPSQLDTRRYSKGRNLRPSNCARCFPRGMELHHRASVIMLQLLSYDR